MLSFFPMKTLIPFHGLEKLSKQSNVSRLLLEESDFSKKNQPEVINELKAQLLNGKLPSSFNNITKVNFETQAAGDVADRVSKSLAYLKSSEPANSKSSTLNGILVSEEDQFILLLSLDENKTKNRIWEISIKIKKNPTTKL